MGNVKYAVALALTLGAVSCGTHGSVLFGDVEPDGGMNGAGGDPPATSTSSSSGDDGSTSSSSSSSSSGSSTSSSSSSASSSTSTSSSSGTCVPAKTCPNGQNCGGSSPDGCGGMIDCGTCTAPQTCGGGGTTNVCGCTVVAGTSAADVCQPGTPSMYGNCGGYQDNCGNTNPGMYECGSCPEYQFCPIASPLPPWTNPRVCYGCLLDPTPNSGICGMPGLTCSSDFDCASPYPCLNGMCAYPSKNLYNATCSGLPPTCGGTSPFKCAAGQACTQDSDCAMHAPQSSACIGGVCANPHSWIVGGSNGPLVPAAGCFNTTNATCCFK